MLKTRKLLAAAGLAAAALLGSSCATWSEDMSRPVVGKPVDVPDHFMVAASGLGKSKEPSAEEGCRNPMVDPRDGTLLTLRRSAQGIGDYWVEDLKYGVTPRQLLRVDCATGKPLGVVDM